MAFEDALATWLARQRWFAGKGAGLRDLAVISEVPLASGGPALRHLIVSVASGVPDAPPDYYQLLAGYRKELPERLEHARIGPAGRGLQAYDALHDPDLTKALLAALAGSATIGGIEFRALPGAQFADGLDSLVLSAEQSNTSLIYGEESILKVFRRLVIGPNPDLEVTSALARLGCPHIAEPLAWAQAPLGGDTTVLALLSRYLRLASDGWSLAATSVRDLYAMAGSAPADAAGGDFAGESRRLGEATARVHADLAEAFGAGQGAPGAARELAAAMTAKLDATVAAVPELGKYAETIAAAYSELAALREPLAVQRVHGDYHLGQVLRTEAGWVVLDFEGEPATPLEQRRALSSPLRDVAGMLRSFDYAARHQLIGHPDAEALGARARDWARRNAAAFCAGYAARGGLDPDANAVLLRALVLDKAVYEVLYEARHRPSWLPIPLESVADF